MSGAFEIGAAALRADQRALETHANNVANINTPGFKRSDNRFSEAVARSFAATLADAGADAGNPRNPAGSVGSGVRISQHPMLFEQGALRTTGNELDIAISGRGFIEVMGVRGEALLWRGGNLRVNEDGMLATASGLALRDAITIPYDATGLRIASDGVVSAQTAAGEIVDLGQIGLVDVDNETAVERLDDGLLRLSSSANARSIEAGEQGAGRLVQGSLEESNVELTEEMVQMMIVQRSFAANAQIVQAADQLAAITNNLRR